MVHVIVKLGEWYYIWSTITDAFRTAAMSLDELKKWCREYDKEKNLCHFDNPLDERLQRVEKYGTSFYVPTSVKLIWDEYR